MGNRVIKESIKRSAEIDQLTWFEYACFINLIVTVDDYGRYLANPIILKNDLFPTKEDVTKKSIIEALEKLRSLNLIQIYQQDGKDYLQLTTWKDHQTIRNQKSKYPAPPENNCMQLNSIERKCSRNPIQSESNPNPNPTPTPHAEETDENADLFRIREEQNEILNEWERGGFPANLATFDKIIELYSIHGKEKMLEAISTTVEAAPHSPLQYLKAVLDPKKKPAPGGFKNKTAAAAFTQRDYTDETDDMDRMMEEAK